MKTVYTKAAMNKTLLSTYSDADQVRSALQSPAPPQQLVAWLSQLALLHGVPFNYLVPDERMLPPESIRFFYLDLNWVNALVDGAFSIGRNLTADANPPQLNLDRAVHPEVMEDVTQAKAEIRAKLFGVTAPAINASIISGFVLRSQLVLNYPSMGVNVYPLGHTPNDPQAQMLPILRMDPLGPNSDTLICLVSGDSYRVDIHEAPQALHYGIDSYTCPTGGPVSAQKNIHTFGITPATSGAATTNSVTMSKTGTTVDISSCFRPNSPRVIELDTLAQLILATNTRVGPPPGTTAPTSIDSAEMGFEMTEGVGMVSFIKST